MSLNHLLSCFLASEQCIRWSKGTCWLKMNRKSAEMGPVRRTDPNLGTGSILGLRDRSGPDRLPSLWNIHM